MKAARMPFSSSPILFGALTICLFGLKAWAGSTDISSQPLATMPTVKAKPNLLFVLDDSGSMNYSYMPDDLGVSTSGTDQPYLNWYGYYSPQCNGLAFDPNGSYPPPISSTGVSYSDIDVTNAPSDGYVSSSSKKNLTSSYYFVYQGSEAKPMNWTYLKQSGGGTDVDTSTTFYKECSTQIVSGYGWSATSNPGTSAVSNTKFTKVLVSSLSADQKQKYANWYSYYRKRFLLMRTAMGRAISALDSGYRVGFSTIHDTGVIDGANSNSGDLGYFRDVKDFDAAQKANFYSSLYGATPGDATPLRAALSKAGRYYAKKISGQTYDPIQYSCQRNYTLLSTDGYWNGDRGKQLDGTTDIGQQDGTEDRPMRDDTKSILTKVDTYTAPATRIATALQSRTRTWTKTTKTSTKGTGTGSSVSNCGSTRWVNTTLIQTYVQTQTQGSTTPQSGTATYTVTTVTTDGVVTSGPTTSSTTTSGWVNSAAATPFSSDTGDASDTSAWSGSPSAACQTTSIGNSVSTPTATNWSSWSPSTTSSNYTSYSSPVTGTWSVATNQTPSTSGGTSNTLADVAEYYWKTDLRSTENCTSSSSGSNQNVCNNIVPTLSTDPAKWQHMNTFTIGLGVSGTLPYDKNYLTQTVGAYVDLKNGPTNWPSPPSSGNDATTVDDLWHAAVNGRGQYYSALNASALSEAISGVVTAVQAVAGSASAASTSSLELVAGDNNKVFGASYTTGAWTGDLQAFALTGETAQIGNTALWSAQSLLDAKTSRNIYFSNGSSLQSFTYANLGTAQKAYFDNFCSKSVIAGQCTQLSDTDKALANDGARLVNWLRGDRTHEAITGSTAALYRKREHVLGDIINGAPQYVGKPPFGYADSGYANFASANSTRTPVVYVAANDGMLHAFSAATGAELWAYVPGGVMANMYKLADSSYASKHQYYVDAPPVMGDIKVGNTWKTILVGGLGAGGNSYYALDITDPANPQALWEFTDANMGATFGNPMIVKRADGTWVVALTSGYNNTSGDGKGHLYVLNANTGAKLLDIATSAGSSSDPSGLAKINAWVESVSDNTATRFYGGDLQGNLWRFDIDNLVPPNQKAMLLAKFQINAATPQPITTKPQPAEISGKPVIVVATGRYLGTTDIEDATQQSIYAIKDPLTATGWGDVRADTANFVTQTFTLSQDASGKNVTANVSNNAVNWDTKAGWRVDLPQTGERVSSNMVLQFTTLAFATTIPTGNACDSGGSSWLYYLNVANGGFVTNNPAGSLFSSNSLVVGLSWVQTSTGDSKIIVQGSDGTRTTASPQVDGSGAAGSAVHRTSWRELVD